MKNNAIILFKSFLCSVIQKSAFHRAQTLEFKNGHTLPRRPAVGTGQDPLLSVNISHSERNQLIRDIPNLTYGTDTHRPPPLDFIPAHAAYDKKVTRSYLSIYNLSLSIFLFILSDCLYLSNLSIDISMYACIYLICLSIDQRSVYLSLSIYLSFCQFI